MFGNMHLNVLKFYKHALEICKKTYKYDDFANITLFLNSYLPRTVTVSRRVLEVQPFHEIDLNYLMVFYG